MLKVQILYEYTQKPIQVRYSNIIQIGVEKIIEWISLQFSKHKPNIKKENDGVHSK